MPRRNHTELYKYNFKTANGGLPNPYNKLVHSLLFFKESLNTDYGLYADFTHVNKGIPLLIL